MSDKSPNTTPSEEVDLGQLFKLIGNAFERFFNFIGSILNKLFLAFVWLVFFVKKHFIKLAIAGIIGVAFGYINKSISIPTYKSQAVFKQNYQTGQSLYTLLDYYNQLIAESDSITLSASLEIDASQAVALTGFEIESVLNDNQKLKLFDEYTKELDSTLATTVKYEDFLKNSDEFNHRYQRITLKSVSNKALDKVFLAIEKNIENNSFFKNEQRKDLQELERKESLILESLKESDTLQSVYKEVLAKSVEIPQSGSQTSVTIDNTEDKSVTKEFELFTNDIELRRELASIRRQKEDILDIVEIVSMQQSDGTIDNTLNLIGFETSSKILIGILFAFILFVILIVIDFVKYLERFKDKI